MNPIFLAAVLVVAPSAFGQNSVSQAGNHASVQSGQFLNTNNDPQFSPYASNLQEQPRQQQWAWGPQQQYQQQQQQNGFAQQRNEGQLCAGCLPSPLSVSSSSGSGMMGQQGGYMAPNNNINMGSGSKTFNNGQGFGYSYDVQLTQPPSQWGQVRQQSQVQQDPATVQHLQINDDGQYSFSYNSADSSRQEQRNLDGTVVGNYAYTDPTGQQVQVEYRAAPNEGYHAFGNNIPQQNPVAPLPAPVQDTPEVQAARAQFFQAYDEQIQRIQQETARNLLLNQQQQKEEDKKIVAIFSENAKDNSSKTSEGIETPTDAMNKGSPAPPTDFKNLPELIAVPDSNTQQHSELEEDDELDNDAVVISSDDTDRPKAVPVRVPQQTRQEPQGLQRQEQVGQGPNPAFQISQTVGADAKYNEQVVPFGQQRGEAFNGQNQVQEQQSGSNKLSSGLPAYFYYVSVGGSPHYVTSSNLLRSDFPTSLKANLVGAIPLSAVHDAQVPHSSGGQAQVKSTPPVYLDFDNKNQQQGFSYSYNSNNNNMDTMNMNVQQQKQQQQNTPYVYGFFPGTLVSFRNDGALNQNQQQTQQMSNSNNGQQSMSQNQVPLVGYPFFVFRK